MDFLFLQISSPPPYSDETVPRIRKHLRDARIWYDLFYHQAEYGGTGTLPSPTGEKVQCLFFVRLFYSVMLLNGKVHERHFTTNVSEQGNGFVFDIIG